MLQPLTLGPVDHGALPDWAPGLARQTFHFAPAIVGIAPNEWTLRRVTAHDVAVVNAVTGEDLTIPRRHIGTVMGECVALNNRLEAHRGCARPVDRGVIVMPPAANAPRLRHLRRGNVVAIREAAQAPPRWRRWLRAAIALGCLTCFAAAALRAFEDVPPPLFQAQPR